MLPNPAEAPAGRYTACDALLGALHESGVTHIFGNLGSDHAGIVQSLARAKLEGRPMPQVILSPHEGMALAAAHGYAQVTGQAQAVFVHVDVGTQNMGGGISNALHGRVPVFIFAGLTPFTLEGELPGSRNRSATYLQDVPDQGGIVRQYVKWDYSIRTGKNVPQLVQRAMQIAHSDPKGPVYLTGAREVLEEDVSRQKLPAAQWRPVEAAALPDEHVAEIARALLQAENPLLITSYSGRNAACVGQLQRLCERLALRVVEERPIHMNFPADHPLHQGYQAGALIGDADVIVVLDCDVPWIPSGKQRPRPEARIFYVDVDPLKETIPLWYMPSERFLRADSATALGQLNAWLDGAPPLDEARRAARLEEARGSHEKMRADWKRKATLRADGTITPEMVTACLNELLDSDAIVVNEAVTNASAVFQHLPRTQPGTFFGSGGSSLGWAGGAALGVKLAAPDRDVVCFTGDGSFFFINPSSVYWCARRYQAPFLTVVFNNQGWNATQQNFKRIHGAGSPMDIGDCVSLAPSADFGGIAQAAGGALALTVQTAEELPGMLARALAATRSGQCAVLDVRLPGI
ncbi:thiamine pyrophosphate-requiring protein [Pusillimonas noertemannii]|uniref:thiamine pyrophosphate-requiring protein n=1 Tax=Pusillimonas noertemannii TaxID=305977 RepID=UPI003342B384